MKASFERFTALRYLAGARGRKEGTRFLRFITYVAIGGVAVGVAALLLALSIVRGFSREIEAKIVGFGAHVQVESMRDAPLGDADELMQGLARIEGVVDVVPVVNEFVLLRHTARDIEGVVLWGAPALPTFLQSRLVEGSGQLDGTSETQGMIIGEKLADQLSLTVGDRVTVFSMKGETRQEAAGLMAAQRPRVKQFVVSGIFETSLANFDEQFVFTDIGVARTLLDYAPDQVSRIDLSLADVAQAPAVVKKIEAQYEVPIMANTIYEVYRGLFAWVRLQESIIPVVIGVIILVAAFNIIGTMLMIILEKTPDIGILASMGASSQRIRRMFLWLGFFVGGVGAFIGAGLALVLALVQQKYGIIPLPEEAYYMSTAPIALSALDFVFVTVLALLLCLVAAYFPARFASKIEPLRVLRFR